MSLGKYRGEQYISPDLTVGEPRCLVSSKWMRISRHTVRIPSNGDIVDDWLWVDYHDRVNVLVEDEQTDDGGERRFLVFRQSKYALEGKNSLAVVGGIIEPGETAIDAARREVDEEMGMNCERVLPLGRFRTDVNRGMGWVNSFVAMKCTRRSGARKFQPIEHGDEVGAADTEHQSLRSLTLTEITDAARKGQFLEVQWSNTVSLALLNSEVAT